MRHIERQHVAPFDWKKIAIRDLTAASPAGSASVAHLEVPPAAAHPVGRSRRCDKYYIGVSGEVRFRAADRDVVLRQGDLLVLERGEWFSYENTTAEPAHLLLVHVPPFDPEQEELRE